MVTRESSVRQTAARGLPWVRSLSELQYNTKPNRPETKVRTAFAPVRIHAGVGGPVDKTARCGIGGATSCGAGPGAEPRQTGCGLQGRGQAPWVPPPGAAAPPPCCEVGFVLEQKSQRLAAPDARAEFGGGPRSPKGRRRRAGDGGAGVAEARAAPALGGAAAGGALAAGRVGAGRAGR